MADDSTTILQWFISNYPNHVQAMKDADHNYDKDHVNPYHQEGDVWTHTCMVYRMSEHLMLDKNYSDAEKACLRFAALLHDIGKPLSLERDDEKKRVRFFGHEGLSFYMAMDVLDHAIKDDLLPINVKWLCLKLIACHGDMFDNTDPKKIADMFVNNPYFYKMLYHQVEADHLGRVVCPLKVTDQGMNREFFSKVEELIVEHGTKPNYDRFVERPCITFVIGPPCAGKTTFLNRYLPDLDNTNILSRDDIIMELAPANSNYNEAWHVVDQKEVDNIFNSRLQKYLKESKHLIIDRTNMTKKSRRGIINQAKGRMIVGYVFLTSYNELMQRNQSRDGKHIDEKDMHQMMRNFSFPHDDMFDLVNWY